jgi:16S rRNA U1498 N3-methylase RsmE
MQIDELTDVADLVGQLGAGSAGWYLSTAPDTRLVLDLIATIRKGPPLQSLTYLIGPEGGWTDAERAAFDAAGITAVSLGPTILRIETAAVAAAVLASCVVGPALGP